MIYAIGKISSLFGKVKYRFCFILFIRTNSRWNNDLNIKHKECGRSYTEPKKAKDIKEQIDKFDHVII